MQVSGRVPAGSVMNAAQQLSKGRAQLALQLVGFEGQLQTAMQYVFGSAFICQVHIAPTDNWPICCGFALC